LLKQFLFLFYFIFQRGAVRVGRREWHSQTGGGGGISKGESGGSTVAPLNFVVFLFLFLVPHTHDGCDVDGWRDDHNWTNPKVRRGGWLLLIFQ
jgi:hypothetical protein